jgi:hydrogenase maturation protease
VTTRKPQGIARLRPATCDLRPAIIVIGYGNDLRGDDGIGPRVAERVAAWDMPGVQAIGARQLTPELAEQLAQADLVLFVDACLVVAEAANDESTIQLRQLVPDADVVSLRHTSDPRALLALAQALYGHAAPAWLLTVPAVTFDLGAPLSPIAEQGITIAVRHIGELLRQARSMQCTRSV